MIPNIYLGNYKLLIIPPLVLILLSLFFIPSIKLGVDFTGGTLVVLKLEEQLKTDEIQEIINREGLKGTARSFQTPLGPTAEIEFSQDKNLVKADQLRNEFNKKMPELIRLEAESSQNISKSGPYNEKRKETDKIANELFAMGKLQVNAENIENINILQREFSLAYNKVYGDYRDRISKPIEKHIKYSSVSVRSVSPVLSLHFIEKASQVIIFSAILSMIFVFLFFRVAVPSLAVLIGAASDVIIAMGAMGFFGIPLTLPSFAALLMLIGFSLDTDILLTMRMLKTGGNPRQKVFDSLKTGATMSIAALVAFLVLFGLGLFTRIATYYEISAVALAGLVADLFATWGVNAVLVLWYVEKNQSPGDVNG